MDMWGGEEPPQWGCVRRSVQSSRREVVNRFVGGLYERGREESKNDSPNLFNF